MSEKKLEFEKALAKSYKEAIDESQPEELPPSVAQLKEDIEKRIEAENIGNEFLEKIMPVVDSRRRLAEAETDVASSLSAVREILNSLSSKIDTLAELKKSNLAQERKVLTVIEEMLKKNK
jgi:hypothetical protein